MNFFKYVESNPVLKDRVSTVIIFITLSAFIFALINEYESHLFSVVILGGLTVDIVWCHYFLPKRPNASILSKKEYVCSFIFEAIVPAILLQRVFFPGIIPECLNMAPIGLLFVGLTYFALSTPTPRGAW